MNHFEIAERMGLTLLDLDFLIKGEATFALAQKFGVTMMDINEFARGNATFAMTQRLGFKTMNAASELAKTAGGVGILIGYLMNMRTE